MGFRNCLQGTYLGQKHLTTVLIIINVLKANRAMTVKREHLYFMFYPLQGVLYNIPLFCHSKKPTWLSSILKSNTVNRLNFLSLGNEAGYQFRSRGGRGKRLMKDVSMEIQHNTIGPRRKSGNYTIKFSRDYSNA